MAPSKTSAVDPSGTSVEFNRPIAHCTVEFQILIPAMFGTRRIKTIARLKGKTVAKWAIYSVVLGVLGYTYYQVPGYIHSVFYDHDTFRDCTDCPEMVVIVPGSFLMGSDDTTPEEKPAHRVTIDYKFAVGKYEVSQVEWRSVMGNDPSRVNGDSLPVDRVSWHDVQRFIGYLNIKTGLVYRLLSEAEWEYMARAGTTTRWSCGSNPRCLALHGWSAVNSYGNNPVGQKKPNDFGVYDTHGNVWEWVEDCYEFGYRDAPMDGSARSGPKSCERVMRGGSIYTVPWKMRSAARFRNLPENKFLNLGFRIARTL